MGRAESAPRLHLRSPIVRGAAADACTALNADFGGVSAGLTRVVVETLQGLAAAGVGAELGKPAVGSTSNAPYDRLSAAAHPQGNRPLDGQGVDARGGDRVPPTPEGDHVLGPQGAHQRHLLLHPAAAGVEVLAQGLVLNLVPADANAQPKAAAA